MKNKLENTNTSDEIPEAESLPFGLTKEDISGEFEKIEIEFPNYNEEKEYSKKIKIEIEE